MSTLGWRCWELANQPSLLRFVSVSRVCFFTRHCLLFERTICLWQCTNLEHKCAGNLFGRVRPVVPPCHSGARVLRLKFRTSQGDSKVLLLFFFFATICASICRVGSFPTPFSRACVACGFSDAVIYLSVRRCWTFTVRFTRHLDNIGLCFGGAHASCVHRVVVGIVCDCFVFIEYCGGAQGVS